MKRLFATALLATTLLGSASSYAVVCTYQGPLGGMWTRNASGTHDMYVAKMNAKMACERGKAAPGRCRFVGCERGVYRNGFHRPGY